jgi:hypothetical protein
MRALRGKEHPPDGMAAVGLAGLWRYVRYAADSDQILQRKENVAM